MILHGDTLDPKTLPVYDICIVGSGAVGISMAHRLRGAKKKDGTPLQVVVLESSVENIQQSHSPNAIHGYDPLINLPPHVTPASLLTEKHWIDPIVAEMDLGETNAFVQDARRNGAGCSRSIAKAWNTRSCRIRRNSGESTIWRRNSTKRRPIHMTFVALTPVAVLVSLPSTVRRCLRRNECESPTA